MAPYFSCEEYMELEEQGRFSTSKLQSTVRNLAATWTHSGHLNGRSRKTRSGANATPGSVSMALWMGYVCGARGETLFETEYARITLDFRVNIAHETP